MRSPCVATRAVLTHHTYRKPAHSNEDTAQPKIKETDERRNSELEYRFEEITPSATKSVDIMEWRTDNIFLIKIPEEVDTIGRENG